jgi:hypothetical protein
MVNLNFGKWLPVWVALLVAGKKEARRLVSMETDHAAIFEARESYHTFIHVSLDTRQPIHLAPPLLHAKKKTETFAVFCGFSLFTQTMKKSRRYFMSKHNRNKNKVNGTQTAQQDTIITRQLVGGRDGQTVHKHKKELDIIIIIIINFFLHFSFIFLCCILLLRMLLFLKWTGGNRMGQDNDQVAVII